MKKVIVNTKIYKDRMKSEGVNFSKLMCRLYDTYGFQIYQCGVSKALNGKSLSLKTHMAMCDVLGLKLDDVFSLVEEQ
ncbi:hypothetical protein G6Z26_06405 [Clostridium perfringens]|uniref:hypothetical protein n=1 Tax=Clostridium perfringens TaxID=1502 RepID=UPI0013E39550|nr:hypothetical protein [Clostridium perfringens]MDK0684968.1 hypothetical protein [Clostridium perfringens]MDM0493301.1 hypothetical protein [Clostridium perfringens]NGT31680.1 hypothetical protein [Clostridium perfringens]NGU09400.1 hypothetical protein [Clostridium perfringens]